MRTAVFLAAGLALLALAVLAAWHASPRAKHAATARVALVFIPVWFAVAGWNLVTGLQAGYGVMAELPLFLAIFVPPALVAFWIRARFAHR